MVSRHMKTPSAPDPGSSELLRVVIPAAPPWPSPVFAGGLPVAHLGRFGNFAHASYHQLLKSRDEDNCPTGTRAGLPPESSLGGRADSRVRARRAQQCRTSGDRRFFCWYARSSPRRACRAGYGDHADHPRSQAVAGTRTICVANQTCAHRAGLGSVYPDRALSTRYAVSLPQPVGSDNEPNVPLPTGNMFPHFEERCASRLPITAITASG